MSRVFKMRGYWYIDYVDPKGRRRRKKSSPYKQGAITELNRILDLIAKGEYESKFEKSILFDDFAKTFLKRYSKPYKTSESYRRDIVSVQRHLMPQFQGLYLSEITPAMLDEYQCQRIENGVKEGTVNRELACLKTMYNTAIKWGYAKSNPVREVKMFKEPPPRVRYLKREEIDRLLSECDQHLKPIVTTALHTGLRKSALLRLKWQDIDPNAMTITIHKTKGNKRLIIPLSSQLYEELRKLPRHIKSGYVFCDKEGKPYKDFRTSFKAALRRAGITDFRIHDLRHTFASILRQEGTDLGIIQQLLGHEDIETTMRYAHIKPSQLSEAVEKVGNYLATEKIEDKKMDLFDDGIAIKSDS